MSARFTSSTVVTEEAIVHADSSNCFFTRFGTSVNGRNLPGFEHHLPTSDSSVDGRVVRGVERAQEQYDIVVGLISIVSRSLGPSSARDTVAFTLNWRAHLVGFDLADAEEAYPASECPPCPSASHST